VALAALTLMLLPAPAGANGRPPAPLQVAFDPSTDLTVAVGNTFGLALSSDGGQHWNWICEQAIGYAGTYDPVVSVTRGGSIWVTTYIGLARSTDGGCTWSFATGLDGYQVDDLAVSPDGQTLLLTTSTAGLPNSVFRSSDAGASFAPATLTAAGGGAAKEDLYTSVKLAPSDPTVGYASGLSVQGGTTTTLYGSRDGGQTWNALPASGLPGGQSYIVGAIAPDDPGRLLLRVEPKVAVSNKADALFLSTDGGMTFTNILSVPAALNGLAYGSTGMQVWGSSVDALYRSTDGGTTFSTVATAGQAGAPRFHCLTVRNDLVYVCADPLMDGYAAARTADNGATFTAVLAYPSLNGPLQCPASTPVGMMCGSLWPALASQIGAPVTPLPQDGGPTTDGGTLPDLGFHLDAGPGGGGGGCATVPGDSDCTWLLLVLAALAMGWLLASGRLSDAGRRRQGG
jgi:photosystem II stability/assembly factor-like uncharacterized protein